MFVLEHASNRVLDSYEKEGARYFIVTQNTAHKTMAFANLHLFVVS